MTEEFKLALTLVPKFDTEALRSAMTGTIVTPGGTPSPQNPGGGEGGGSVPPNPGAGGGGEGGGGGGGGGGNPSPQPQAVQQAASQSDPNDATEELFKKKGALARLKSIFTKIVPESETDEKEEKDPEAEEKRAKAWTGTIMKGVSMGSQALKMLATTSLGFVEDIYRRMRDASPLLQSVESLFNLAMTLFFMPLGNKLAEVLIPATVELLDAVVEIWDAFEGKSIGEAMAYAITKGTQIFGTYIQDIGNTLKDEQGVVGTIGRFMVKIGEFVENKGASFIEAMLNLASWIMDNFKSFVSLYVSLQTAQLGAIIGGSSLLGNITGPWGALAGAAIGAGAGYGATSAILTDLGFAEGGKVAAREGGQWVLVGEGGQDEYIIPEDKMNSALKYGLSESGKVRSDREWTIQGEGGQDIYSMPEGGTGSAVYNISNNFYGYTVAELEEKVSSILEDQITRARLRSGF